MNDPENPTLREICRELNIKWTDKPEDITRMINEQIEYGLYLDRMRADL